MQHNIFYKKSKEDILKKFIAEIGDDSPTFGEHVLGLSLLNKSKGLCIVLIPKNASTSISTGAITSKSDNWLPHIFSHTEHENKKYIVILRDPVDRFISATNMFLTKQKPLYGKLPIISKNNIIIEDCHFQPQCSFINELPRDRIDFFLHKKTVLQDIEKHYSIKFNATATNLNVGKKLITAVNQELIKDLYKKDYELINSIKFVNMP